MSGLSTHQVLTKALGQHCPIYDYQSGQFLTVCGCEQWRLGGVDRAEAERRFGEHLTDALIASGVVVDVATLADDEALMEARRQMVTEVGAEDDRQYAGGSMHGLGARDGAEMGWDAALRALTAALNREAQV